MNEDITSNKLAGKEEGTKLLRGAYLARLDVGSYVGLIDGFNYVSALVSGVVKKSGVAGATQEKGVVYTPNEILDYLEKNPVKDQKFAAGLLDAANKFYQSKK